MRCNGKCQRGGWRAALGVVVRFTVKLAGAGYVKCTTCGITFPGIYSVPGRPSCPCCSGPCKTNPYSFGRRGRKEGVYRHA